METTLMLAVAVIVVEVILVLLSLYLYYAHRLRIFYFLTLGFAALLLSCALQAFILGSGVYAGVLNIAAALFFISGALTAV